MLRLFIFQIEGLQPARFQVAEINIEGGGHDMEVLADRQQVQESEQNEDMQPEGGMMYQEQGSGRQPIGEQGTERQIPEEFPPRRLQFSAGIKPVHDHQEPDHDQHQHRFSGEGQALRTRRYPPDEGSRHRDQHQQLEQLFDQQIEPAETVMFVEKRQFEAGLNPLTQESDGVEQHGDETEEDDGVHDAAEAEAGFKQLPLAEQIYQQAFHPRTWLTEAVDRLHPPQRQPASIELPGEEQQGGNQDDEIGGIGVYVASRVHGGSWLVLSKGNGAGYSGLGSR